MDPDDTDAALVARLAPRLQALHEASGDWTGTVRDALALLRETHTVVPHDASGGPDTPATPREDD